MGPYRDHQFVNNWYVSIDDFFVFSLFYVTTITNIDTTSKYVDKYDSSFPSIIIIGHPNNSNTFSSYNL